MSKRLWFQKKKNISSTYTIISQSLPAAQIFSCQTQTLENDL